MSGKDDPFGSGGKTVIRPNPGGVFRPDSRADAGRSAGAAASRDPARCPSRRRRPSSRRPPAIARRAPQPQRLGAPPPRRSPGMLGAGSRRRTPSSPSSRVPTRRLEPAPQDPARGRAQRARRGRFSAANPITAAAAPLLILLGRLRLHDRRHAGRAADAACRRRRSQEFEQQGAATAGVSQDRRAGRQIRALRAPPTTSSRTCRAPTGTSGCSIRCWRSSSRSRTSGVGFFEELEQGPAAIRRRATTCSSSCTPACRSASRASTAARPAATPSLQRIRRDVYQTLRHLKRPQRRGHLAALARARAAGCATSARASRSGRSPRVAAPVLVGVFFLLRFLLGNDGDASPTGWSRSIPATQITHRRAAFVPPSGEPPSATRPSSSASAPRSRPTSRPAASPSTRSASRSSSASTTCSCSIPARPTVKDEFEPLAAQIAAALDNEPGPISVDRPYRQRQALGAPRRFKSNYDLSVARAKSVADGAGKADSPIRRASSSRAAARTSRSPTTRRRRARAQNRRVEIMIPREETLNVSVTTRARCRLHERKWICAIAAIVVGAARLCRASSGSPAR